MDAFWEAMMNAKPVKVMTTMAIAAARKIAPTIKPSISGVL